jgi:magnesium transporter
MTADTSTNAGASTSDEDKLKAQRERQDTMIRVTAFHHEGLDRAVLLSPSFVHEPVRESIVEPFASEPTASLGILDALPREVILELCLRMSVETLFRFRQTNRLARRLISSLKSYRIVLGTSMDLVRGAMRTYAARYLTIEDLWLPMYNHKCFNCGRFAPFFFFPKALRCCYLCMTSEPQLAVASLQTFCGGTGVCPSRVAELLPVMRGLAGRYASYPRRALNPDSLVAAADGIDRFQALGLPLTIHRNERKVYNDRECLRCMLAMSMPCLDDNDNVAETGLNCKGCQLDLEWHNEPYLQGHNDRFDPRFRTYTRKGFLRHFRNCRMADEIWQDYLAGTHNLPEPKAVTEYWTSEFKSDPSSAYRFRRTYEPLR